VLRFGEETPNQFNEGEVSHFWHHLTCAAQKKSLLVKEALASFTGTGPEPNEVSTGSANCQFVRGGPASTTGNGSAVSTANASSPTSASSPVLSSMVRRTRMWWIGVPAGRGPRSVATWS